MTSFFLLLSSGCSGDGLEIFKESIMAIEINLKLNKFNETLVLSCRNYIILTQYSLTCVKTPPKENGKSGP